MLEILLLVGITSVSALLTARRWAARNVSFVFYGAFFLIFGVVPLASHLFGQGEGSPAGVVSKAYAITLATIICLCLGEAALLGERRAADLARARAVGSRSRPRVYISDWEARVVMWVALAFSLVGFAYIMWGGGASPAESLRVPGMKLRLERAGLATTVSYHMLAVSMIALYLALERPHAALTRWAVLSLVTVINGGVLMVAGSRAIMLHVVSPLLLYCVRMRAKWRRAVSSALLVAALVLSLGIFHVFRWSAERIPANLLRTVQKSSSYEFMARSPASVLNARDRLFLAVELFPREHGWLYGNTYRTMALFWLPSSLSGGLKMDTMYLFARVASENPRVVTDMLSNHPTFVGDLYMNFGYLFWLGALVWGLVFGWIHRTISLRRNNILSTIVGSAWIYFLVIAFGGSIYQPFLRLIGCTVLLLVAVVFGKILWILLGKVQGGAYREPSGDRYPGAQGQRALGNRPAADLVLVRFRPGGGRPSPLRRQPDADGQR